MEITTNVENIQTIENLLRIFKEIIFEAYYYLLELLYAFLVFYSFLVATRITISWLLIINPYFYPFSLLWTITDPIVRRGTHTYPKIFGISFAFHINMVLLNKAIEFVKYLLVEGNSFHQSIITQDL